MSLFSLQFLRHEMRVRKDIQQNFSLPMQSRAEVVFAVGRRDISRQAAVSHYVDATANAHDAQ
jgi:hypothetical protein